MTGFDYAAAADCYFGKPAFRMRHLRHRRFDTAAEALRFAIEELPAAQLPATVLEVNEERFQGAKLRAIYDAEAYPLPRSDRAHDR